jgi:hypothetical protein
VAMAALPNMIMMAPQTPSSTITPGSPSMPLERGPLVIPPLPR